MIPNTNTPFCVFLHVFWCQAFLMSCEIPASSIPTCHVCLSENSVPHFHPMVDLHFPIRMSLNNVKHFIKLHQVAIFRPTFPPFVGEAPFFGPGKQPWVGAPVNSCMNLAMRTFEADNSLEAEESVIKASTGVIWFEMDIIRI